jgi:glycosyltransferase involved in cell wall biosynthesis
VRVIRSRGVYHTGALAVLVGRRVGVPVVVSLGAETNRLAFTQLGTWPVAGSRWLSSRVEELVLRHADRVLVPNDTIRRYVLALGARADRVRTVPLRPRREFFDPSPPALDVRARAGVPADAPFVLYVGRLDRDKDVLGFAEAAPAVLAAHPRAVIVLVGDGPERDAVVARLRARAAPERVTVLGFQPSSVVRALMQEAAAVCVPKAGFTLLEAAAVGAPVVAYDVEWQRELIAEGTTGRLVPYGDVTALGRVLAEVVADHAGARKLGDALRQQAIAQLAPDVVAAREIAVYDELLSPA